MPITIPYRFGTDGRWFYGHQAISKADGATFAVLNHIWARDNKTVYAYGKPLRKADLATFTVLNNLFAKDRGLVFETNGPLKGADAATFEVLDDGYFEYEIRNSFGDVVSRHDEFSGYARDKSFVYRKVLTYKTRVLKKADRDSFQVLTLGFAHDCRRAYFDGDAIKSADPATFEPVGHLWGRDCKHAYYGTSVIENADPATFALFDENNYLTRDRVNFFFQRGPAGPEHITFNPGRSPIGRPLVAGLRLGVAKVAQYLAAGADPDREPLALQLACQYHDVEMVQLLLDNGANPNTCSPVEKSPVLTFAVYNREPLPMVKLLLDAGADVNGGGGRLPLEAALVGGKWDLAEFLVAKGADVNGLAHTGQRLLDYAKSLTSAKRMIEFLQSHGAT